MCVLSVSVTIKLHIKYCAFLQNPKPGVNVCKESRPFLFGFALSPETFFLKKIVCSRPSTYSLKNYCGDLSGPPLGLNDYSLAPPTRR